MLLHPNDEASNIRVAALPQSEPLLEFSAEIDRAPVGPIRTDRRRHKSASRVSRAWRALTNEVASDGRWFKDLRRLRSRAWRESGRLLTSPVTRSGLIFKSSIEMDALIAFL